MVRAREAAKTDELRAKHRLSKYLLRYGKYPPAGARAWALPYWRWIKTVKLDQPAQNMTLLEVEHQGARVERLEFPSRYHVPLRRNLPLGAMRTI